MPRRRYALAAAGRRAIGGDPIAWPSPWVTTAAIADQQGGAYRLLTAATPYAQGFARRTGPDHGELAFKWKWTSAESDRSVTAVVRGRDTFGENPKYEIRANPDSLWLRRSGELLDSDATLTFAVNTWYWFRVNWSGTLIRARGWEDGTSEPSVWHVEVTDPTGPSSGNVLIRIENGNDTAADTLLVSNITITGGFGVAPFGTSPFGS